MRLRGPADQAAGRPRTGTCAGAAIAAFSLVIYYWAVRSTLPHQRVSSAVEQVEAEASIELDKALI